MRNHRPGIALLLCSLLTLAGCAENPYDNARAFAMTGIVADAATTSMGVHQGCTEMNPMYGSEQPNDGVILGLNLALAGLIWWLADTFEEDNGPTWPIYVAGALKGGLAIHNIREMNAGCTH